MQINAQTAYWKVRICQQKKFSKKDSITFCHLFDSLNREYNIKRIVHFESKKSRFIPLLGNTISFKDTLFMFKYWIEELSHAVQFSERKTHYEVKAFFESAKVLYRYIFFNKKYRYRKDKKASLHDVYQSTYDDKNSFEYEAHEIIEPILHMYVIQRLKNAP